jgi:hypothetical protein
MENAAGRLEEYSARYDDERKDDQDFQGCSVAFSSRQKIDEIRCPVLQIV